MWTWSTSKHVYTCWAMIGTYYVPVYGWSTGPSNPRIASAWNWISGVLRALPDHTTFSFAAQLQRHTVTYTTQYNRSLYILCTCITQPLSTELAQAFLYLCWVASDLSCSARSYKYRLHAPQLCRVLGALCLLSLHFLALGRTAEFLHHRCGPRTHKSSTTLCMACSWKVYI